MIVAPDPRQVSEGVATLAILANRLVQRPPYLALEPLAVDRETYVLAEGEMREVLRARGWHAPPLSHALNRVNFLLMGVPVVCMDS